MNAVIVGIGQTATAVEAEFVSRGFLIDSSAPAQVLVFVDATDAQAILAEIRARQDELAASRNGRIVLVGSRDWLGWPGRVEEATAQAALVGLTRSLALELGKYGITVNLVCPPGPRSAEGSDDPWSEAPPQLTGEVDATDIAYAVGFAADENSGYFTGQILHVSGGLSVLSSLTA